MTAAWTESSVTPFSNHSFYFCTCAAHLCVAFSTVSTWLNTLQFFRTVYSVKRFFSLWELSNVYNQIKHSFWKQIGLGWVQALNNLLFNFIKLSTENVWVRRLRCLNTAFFLKSWFLLRYATRICFHIRNIYGKVHPHSLLSRSVLTHREVTMTEREFFEVISLLYQQHL